MNEEEQFEDLEEELVDLTQETPLEVEESVEEEIESNIPDKFKGKSVEDVVNSYVELEKAYGQRANDIGEYRKLADQLLEQQLSNKETPTKEEIFDVENLLDNPEEMVSKLVEKQTKPLMDELQQYKRNGAKEVFESEHPDYMDVASSQEFQEWIQSNPTVKKIFIDADKNYDYQSGGEVLDLYKQVSQASNDSEQKAVKKKKRSKALKNASTETSTAGTPSRKVFSRKQLMHLRLHNKPKYDSMSTEINLAYAEGRVKD